MLPAVRRSCGCSSTRLVAHPSKLHKTLAKIVINRLEADPCVHTILKHSLLAVKSCGRKPVIVSFISGRGVA